MKYNQMEALDFRYLLLEYYKKIHLKEDEVMIILMIDLLLGQKNKLITAELLSLKMNLTSDYIDKCLVKLINDGLLAFDTKKGMKFSLKPLREKLFNLFEEAFKKDKNLDDDKNKSAYLQNIYAVFEKELKRPLSPVEFSLIQDWIDSGYKDEDILNAIKEIRMNNKRLSIKAVDKVLLSYKAREDIDKTGYTSVSDNWDKNLEETLKIAKVKWIDD